VAIVVEQRTPADRYTLDAPPSLSLSLSLSLTVFNDIVLLGVNIVQRLVLSACIYLGQHSVREGLKLPLASPRERGANGGNCLPQPAPEICINPVNIFIRDVCSDMDDTVEF